MGPEWLYGLKCIGYALFLKRICYVPRLSSQKLTHLRQELDRFWNVESINPSTDSVVDQFEKDIIHDGTRYIAKLPFKPHHEVLPDNFKACEGGLRR